MSQSGQGADLSVTPFISNIIRVSRFAARPGLLSKARGGLRLAGWCAARPMLIILLLIVASGCGSRYVVRQEFDYLRTRVGHLEATVGVMSGGSLPLAASSGLNPPAASAHNPLPPTGAELLPPAGSTVVKAGGTEKSMYQQGQNLLKQKKYDQAASVFSDMLRQYPAGSLAPNARYWLGECYYASGRWSSAAAEFQRCADDFPQSAKAPDSLLKLSYSYDKMGDGPQAMAAMDRLLTQYPRSSAAGMVKNRQSRFSG